MADTVHLVDGSLYVCRAWFAQVPDAQDADGHPVHAVHGFARFLLDLFERARPTHLAVAFDESLNSSFRNALYPAYKANRPAAPEDLMRQFAGCKAVARAFGATVLSDGQYEADDLIGSALHAARPLGFRGLIVSADKDLSQLLHGADEQWDYARGQRWTAAGVKARHGVHAHQIADYLALCGDAVDNIPGVPGIGAKTAAVLLAHFESLDLLLARIDEVPFLRVRGAAGIATKLREHREQALLWRRLTTIALDAPLEAGHFERGNADAAMLSLLCEALRFGPMTRRRLQAACGAAVPA
jgi:5'-3' exonuclease